MGSEVAAMYDDDDYETEPILELMDQDRELDGAAAMALVARHKLEYEQLITEARFRKQIEQQQRTIQGMRRQIKAKEERNPEGINVPVYVEQTQGIQQALEAALGYLKDALRAIAEDEGHSADYLRNRAAEALRG